MKIQFVLLSVFTILTISKVAHCQETELGFHEHDGFYLSMGAGIDGLSYRGEQASYSSTKLSDGGGLESNRAKMIEFNAYIISAQLNEASDVSIIYS